MLAPEKKGLTPELFLVLSAPMFLLNYYYNSRIVYRIELVSTAYLMTYHTVNGYVILLLLHALKKTQGLTTYCNWNETYVKWKLP
jgi:hypothetical protein